MVTVFRDVRAVCPDGVRDAVVVVEDGEICGVCGHFDPAADDVVIDGGGLYLTPGFVDLHVHGGGMRGVMEATPGAIVAMADAHAVRGTTTLLPTTLAMPLPRMLAAAQAVREAMAMPTLGTIAGVHMEGPFLSPAQAGAQSPEALLVPAEAGEMGWLQEMPHLRMMGVAPELAGAAALGERLAARGVAVSVAHSDAPYECVEAAMAHGFSDVTHLYSCCSTVVRRNAFRVAGVVEAGLGLEGLTVQAICDGRHLPPALIRLIYRCKGAGGMYAITDGLEYAAADIADGTVYTQGNGVRIVYEDGVMKLLDRTAFAGSAATMAGCVRTMIEVGIPFADAIRMATETPARRIGLARKGRVQAGCDADLLLLTPGGDVRLCMAGGKVIGGDMR